MKLERMFKVLVVGGALAAAHCGSGPETDESPERGPGGPGGPDAASQGGADAGPDPDAADPTDVCEEPCPEECWRLACECAGGACCWLVVHPCCVSE